MHVSRSVSVLFPFPTWTSESSKKFEAGAPGPSKQS